ncbi:hypothetical protein OCGS_1438 [Oceaniovalibus guishaninsula JLT2003]|uniref:Uncharacterized protein n=1 Tax=Oceaniovalibus guishaninsula JLT2003 TaxID=1231392 RepID=K2I6J2_9RHOB|nr:hypothetical protein [Oceaniovalibus guishaninsula]EKE44600.1 hypothetical protein OCGS_1438 [Oceaniovalibus guishaninsula JLT2003]
MVRYGLAILLLATGTAQAQQQEGAGDCLALADLGLADTVGVMAT